MSCSSHATHSLNLPNLIEQSQSPFTKGQKLLEYIEVALQLPDDQMSCGTRVQRSASASRRPAGQQLTANRDIVSIKVDEEYGRVYAIATVLIK